MNYRFLYYHIISFYIIPGDKRVDRKYIELVLSLKTRVEFECKNEQEGFEFECTIVH